MGVRRFLLGWVWRVWQLVVVTCFVVSVAFLGHAVQPSATTVGSRNVNIAGAVGSLLVGAVLWVLLVRKARRWKPSRSVIAAVLSAVGLAVLTVVAIIFFPITLGVWAGRRRIRQGNPISRVEALAYVQQLLR
jgi:hypothetical protein